MATTRERQNQIFDILGIGGQHKRDSMVSVVKQGLPLTAFDAVAEYARVTIAELSAVTAISQRTLQRRAKTEKKPTLDREQSDRLTRVARLYQFAGEVLGSADAARSWMSTPNRSLDNARPFDLLNTELEAREVEDALGRIQHGVFS
jgi:putative toxin-antitoxin system antitoxin component (TIGR02293 family)